MRHIYDVQVVLSTLTILLIGVLIHYSIGPEILNNHLIYMCIGLGLAFVASRLDYQVIRSFSWHLYLGTIFLLILTILLGTVTRGSRRWIDLGFFQFQPSELTKLVMVVLIPTWIEKFPLHSFLNLIKIGILICIPAFLVLIEPDLGSTIIILFMSFVMLFVGGLPVRYLIIGFLAALVLSPVGWMTMQDYQKDRIYTFLNPEADPLGKGYNSIQSQIAVGSGRFFGRGLGHGTQSKLQFLPEYQTDFVFASLAEELGFIGSFLLLSAYGWLIIRLTILALEKESLFSSVAISGIIAMFIIQLVVNVGMNIGVVPVTGITLPFVSAGGTSLVVSIMAIGMALKLSKKTNLRAGIEITGKDK